MDADLGLVLHDRLEALRGARGAHICSSENLARWMGVSRRTALRVLAGEALPRLEDLVALMHRCPEEAVKRAFLDVLLGGTDMVAVSLSDDGAARSTLGALVRETGEAVGAIESAYRDGRVSDDDLAAIRREARDVAEAALRLERRAELDHRAGRMRGSRAESPCHRGHAVSMGVRLAEGG